MSATAPGGPDTSTKAPLDLTHRLLKIDILIPFSIRSLVPINTLVFIARSLVLSLSPLCVPAICSVFHAEM